MKKNAKLATTVGRRWCSSSYWSSPSHKRVALVALLLVPLAAVAHDDAESCVYGRLEDAAEP